VREWGAWVKSNSFLRTCFLRAISPSSLPSFRHFSSLICIMTLEAWSPPPAPCTPTRHNGSACRKHKCTSGHPMHLFSLWIAILVPPIQGAYLAQLVQTLERDEHDVEGGMHRLYQGDANI
jgi:hypothetical protein